MKSNCKYPKCEAEATALFFKMPFCDEHVEIMKHDAVCQYVDYLIDKVNLKDPKAITMVVRMKFPNCGCYAI